LHSKKAVMNRK